MTGVLLCGICLGKVFGPLLLVVGLAFFLPLLWKYGISKTTQDPIVQGLLLFAAAMLIFGFAQLF